VIEETEVRIVMMVESKVGEEETIIDQVDLLHLDGIVTIMAHQTETLELDLDLLSARADTMVINIDEGVRVHRVGDKPKATVLTSLDGTATRFQMPSSSSCRKWNASLWLGFRGRSTSEV
jgi:hypothetical protein